MVLDVAVRPRTGSDRTPRIIPSRHLILTADVAPEVPRSRAAEESAGTVHAYRYFLGDQPDPHSPQRAIGPAIVLSRGEPVGVTVRNRLPEATSVHWHGIELDNYFDGVAGIGTDGHRISPMIEPGQEFEAMFTPPHAGTFIDHTHMNDLEQVMAGLSGPLIVLNPDEILDAARDHIIFITQPRSSVDEDKFVFVNGMNPPELLDLTEGVKHRFRIVNLHTFMANLKIEIKDESSLLSWRALANDGRDLPKNQQTVRRAQQVVSIGEIYDFEFIPDKPADYRLEIFDPIFRKGNEYCSNSCAKAELKPGTGGASARFECGTGSLKFLTNNFYASGADDCRHLQATLAGGAILQAASARRSLLWNHR